MTISTTKGKAGKGQRGIAGAIKRGRELFLSRQGEMVHVGGCGYLVPSLSRPGYRHAVSVAPEGEHRCDCEHARFSHALCKHVVAAFIKSELPEGFSIERKYGRFGYVYALTGPGGERRGLHLSLGEALEFAAEVAGEVSR